MEYKKTFSALIASLGLIGATGADACTGITLKSKDNSVIAARTIDWSGTEMENMYTIVPRNYTQQSLLPDNATDGMQFISKYGYVGLAVEEPQFVVDGTNEAGLSAALFYFPEYGEYQPYNPEYKDRSIADFQLVSWILSQFSTIDQVKEAVKDIRVVSIDKRAKTVHWRIVDTTGRVAILEIVDGVPNFYDSALGVLTNSPGYPWHMTNLNNYVNLMPGTAGPTKMGAVTLTALGSGSGFLGLPGDFTPPSRFVRAAFLQSYSVQQPTGYDSAMQAFHILNNFDVPLGVQFAVGRATNNMPAATQWTIATDLTNRVIYYHTMYNRVIRSIDMGAINFDTVPYQWHALDTPKQQMIIPAQINDTASDAMTPRSVDEIASKVFSKASASEFE